MKNLIKLLSIFALMSICASCHKDAPKLCETAQLMVYEVDPTVSQDSLDIVNENLNGEVRIRIDRTKPVLYINADCSMSKERQEKLAGCDSPNKDCIWVY